MRCTTTSAGSSLVKPAANRWPPPPSCSAILHTSTVPSERRLTRHAPSEASFSTHATSASRVRRTRSISPSISSKRDVVAGEVGLGDLRPTRTASRRRARRADSTSAASLRYAKRCSSNSVRESGRDRQVEAGELPRELEHVAGRASRTGTDRCRTPTRRRGTPPRRGSAGARARRRAGARARRSPPRRTSIDVDRAVPLVRGVVVDDDQLGRGLRPRLEVAEPVRADPQSNVTRTGGSRLDRARAASSSSRPGRSR